MKFYIIYTIRKYLSNMNYMYVLDSLFLDYRKSDFLIDQSPEGLSRFLKSLTLESQD